MPIPRHLRVLIAALVVVACGAPGRPSEPAMDALDTAGPEAVVRDLYELVTFGPGGPPDWDAVRALFLPEAVVVLRAGDDRMDVLPLDAFVQDFVDFIEASDALARGFTERLRAMETFVYGDVAHVLVHFDSQLGGSERPPSDGLDSIQLVRRHGRWRVTCIVNERPRWAVRCRGSAPARGAEPGAPRPGGRQGPAGRERHARGGRPALESAGRPDPHPPREASRRRS